MRIFLAILILIFNLQSSIKAEDIRDFEIEGMSIGDSLLDYYTEKKIKKNLTSNYRDNEFIETEIKVNSDNYDSVQIRFKKNDAQYKIVSMAGIKWFIDKIDLCYELQNKIYKDVFTLFKNGSTMQRVLGINQS